MSNTSYTIYDIPVLLHTKKIQNLLTKYANKNNIDIKGHIAIIKDFVYMDINDDVFNDFADKNNIDLIITADVAYYYLVDNNDVYIEKGYSNLPDPYNMNSFDDINEYLTKYTNYRGKLQDKIEKLKTYIK